VHCRPDHCRGLADYCNAVVAGIVIVVGFQAYFEVSDRPVGSQADGPAPAGDIELVDASFLIISALDPQFALEVCGDIADFQQVFTGLLRCVDHPVFVITRVDRVELRNVIFNPDRNFRIIVRLEHIGASHVGLFRSGSG
jgi:hypothetical protein